MKKSYSLGPLEQGVMSCLWDTKGKKVNEVYECLKLKRNIAYTTIMTIMTRLVHKGYLSRKKEGRAYVYFPRKTRGQMITSFVKRATNSLVDQFGEEAIVAFADEVDRLSAKKRNKIASQLKLSAARETRS